MQIFMPTTTVKGDRRKKSRNRPPRLVYVELPNGNGGMMRDLSEEGFAVRAMMPLRAGASTSFGFSLGESVRIEGEGEILWIEETGRVAGVRFTQISLTARGQIQNWLGEHGESADREEVAGKPIVPPSSTLQQLREEIRAVSMGGEPPKAIPTVQTEELPETVAAASEVHAGTPPLESEDPTEHPDPLENTILFEITDPLERIDPPESTGLPGMTLPSLRATLLSAKRPARETYPSQGAAPGLPSLPLPVPVPSGAEVIPSAPPAENAPFDLQTTLSGGPIAPVPETYGTTRAAAVPPRLPRMEINATVPPVAPIPDEIGRNFPSPRLTPIEGRTDMEGPRPAPALPDISHVLIPPPGRRAGYSLNSTMLEPLSSLERLREPGPASSTDRFTLSHAFAIMLLLTVVAAVTVFHREVGQSLIWVGEQLGGAQVSESQPPAPGDPVSTEAPTGRPANPSDSAPPPPTVAEPKTQDQRAASEPPAPGDNSEAPLSAGAKNAVPPVTPLSGMTAPSSSNAGQEVGQAEYAQAMQILRGSSSGAGQPEVVRLLWISVEKGNLSAELALAEMYWHGQGVARNCDQARILLSAAVRKGSAEARRRLQQLQREGCE
jgi:hypothetical protein